MKENTSENDQIFRVVHIPEQTLHPPRPPVRADQYPAGTIVEYYGQQWRNYWDEQDHQLEWEQYKPTRRKIDERDQDLHA